MRKLFFVVTLKTMRIEDKDEALLLAIEHMPEPLPAKTVQLAEALGLSKGAVYQWRRVPPEHVLRVEALTGVSRHELRPDIYGAAPVEKDATA